MFDEVVRLGWLWSPLLLWRFFNRGVDLVLESGAKGCREVLFVDFGQMDIVVPRDLCQDEVDGALQGCQFLPAGDILGDLRRQHVDEHGAQV